MGVKLREKSLSNGQVSYYLDIYHNKTRWYEFLDIRINGSRPTSEDKDKKLLAQQIRSKREHELIVDNNGLTDKKKKQACFVSFFEEYVGHRKDNSVCHSTLYNMRLFTAGKPLSFVNVTTAWMKDFERYLLARVTNNTTLSYLKIVNAALNEAVRARIIASNPWHDVPHHQRLKKQDIFRQAYTLDQLRLLANTPCKIEEQIKQAYFFSCFSGLRWSDVSVLRWSEIIVKTDGENEAYYLYFEQEKTEGIEYLPMSPQAVAIIKQRKVQMAESGEKSLYVFSRLLESSLKSHASQQRVNRALKKWAKKAGLDSKHMHFHTSRHSFASNVLESSEDGDLYTVSKLLGHKSIQSTQVYAHVRDKKKHAAVNSLPMIDFSGIALKVA